MLVSQLIPRVLHLLERFHHPRRGCNILFVLLFYVIRDFAVSFQSSAVLVQLLCQKLVCLCTGHCFFKRGRHTPAGRSLVRHRDHLTGKHCFLDDFSRPLCLFLIQQFQFLFKLCIFFFESCFFLQNGRSSLRPRHIVDFFNTFFVGFKLAIYAVDFFIKGSESSIRLFYFLGNQPICAIQSRGTSDCYQNIGVYALPNYISKKPKRLTRAKCARGHPRYPLPQVLPKRRFEELRSPKPFYCLTKCNSSRRQSRHCDDKASHIRVQQLHQLYHAVQCTLDGVRLYKVAHKLRPLVFQDLRLAGPAIQRVFHFLVRAPGSPGKVGEHGLVHIPVLDQRQKLGGTQLAADVADHLHQLLLRQQSVLHALGQTGNGLHGVYHTARRLCRVISVLGVNLDDIPQSGDFAGGPCHALIDLRLGIADDIQEKRPQRGGGFCAASLRHGGDGADSRRQLIHTHMGLRRNRRHLAQALGDLLDGGRVSVVDLVGSVQHGGELFNVALILVRRVHGQKELLRRFGVGIAHDLRLGSQLRQCGCLFAVTGAAEARHKLQVLVRRYTVGAGRLIRLLFDLLQLVLGCTRDLADRHHLVVHGLHGVQRLDKTALYTGDGVAQQLPHRHLQG